jgi:2-polyprenyl-6-methoxyphenol hydroxylase-like FAD-dependent oxidoreductase
MSRSIAGFRPVGQLLGRAGHDIVVLERWPQPYHLPRAVHFDDEIGRIFQAAGIAKEIGGRPSTIVVGSSISAPADFWIGQDCTGAE